MVRGREDDNAPKRDARQHIAAIVNHHFKNKSISMLELLGGGVGLEYYVQHCNVFWATAVELQRKKYVEYMYGGSLMDIGYTPRPNSPHLWKRTRNQHVNVVILRNEDMYEYLNGWDNTSGNAINFVNLDFCGYFCLEDMITRKSTGHIIEKAFERKVISNGGLLATTFMIGGYSLDISRYKDRILTSKAEIENSIKQLAESHGYSIKANPSCGAYSPTKRTTMLYSVFECNLIP